MNWGEVAFVAVATLGVTLGLAVACVLIEWQNARALTEGENDGM